MSVKVGILICGHFIEEVAAVYEDYRALYAPMLGEGFDCQPYFVVDGEMPTAVDEQDGWLVSGSRHGAYEDAWIPPLEDFLRTPVCGLRAAGGYLLRASILAQALGGRVEFDGGWSIGPTSTPLPTVTVRPSSPSIRTRSAKPEAASHRQHRFRLCRAGLSARRSASSRTRNSPGLHRGLARGLSGPARPGSRHRRQRG